MSYSPQKFIFLFFLILFILGGGPLLFYANGWRLNTATYQLERMASLSLQVKPENIEVWIDGARTDRGPTVHSYQTVNNIRPGTHLIKLYQPGFTVWQHTLEFKPGEITFLKGVQLFPETEPLSLPTPTASTVALIDSPDKPLPLVMIQTAATTTLHRIETSPVLRLNPLVTVNMPIQPSDTQNGRHLFRSRGDGNQHQWFILADTTVTSLYKSFPFLFSKMVFDPNQTDSLLAIDGLRLLSLNQKQKTIRQVIKLSPADTIIDIIPRKNYLYLLSNTLQHTVLITFRVQPNNQLTEFSRLPLPLMKQAVMRPSPNDILTIFDDESKILTMVTLESEIPTTTSTIYQVTGTESNPANDSLMWWKDNALWRTDTQTMRHIPLTGFSESIKTIRTDYTTGTRFVLLPSSVIALHSINDTDVHETTLLQNREIIDILPARNGTNLIGITADTKTAGNIFLRPL